jgi:prepilin-type N-terminal cleavage/methylation domain-containing protein
VLTRARHPRGQDGFTLPELLVAMAAGIVVLLGLSAIMIAVMHQTQRTFTKVDATRQARTALANIENEAHSACVGAATPIQAGSTADSLSFLSFYGTSANPTPVWHQITFSSTAGTLTDSSYDVSGTGPDWTQGSLISTTTLLGNVTRQTGSVPVFQYFAYTPEYTDAGGDVYWTIPDGSNTVPVTDATLAAAPLATASGLSATDAGNAVEVLVNLQVGSSTNSLSNGTLANTTVPVTDSISLRLTTPPNEVDAGTSAQGYGPCQ